MEIGETLDNPTFWILGGGGIAAEILGWTLGKNWTGFAFPIWQLIILMIGTLIAAAIFANRE